MKWRRPAPPPGRYRIKIPGDGWTEWIEIPPPEPELEPVDPPDWLLQLIEGAGAGAVACLVLLGCLLVARCCGL